MKRLPQLAALAAIIITLAGCALQPASNQTATTVAVIKATVPLAVAVEVRNDPTTLPYFKVAADTIGAFASATNYAPAILIAEIQAIPGADKNQYAALAVLGGVAIWQAFAAQSVVPDGSNQQQVLTALSAAIKEGCVTSPAALRLKYHLNRQSWRTVDAEDSK